MYTRTIQQSKLGQYKDYLPIFYVLMTFGFMIAGIVLTSVPVACNAADWGTLTTGIDSLCSGAYSNMVKIIRPVAIVALAIAGFAHFGAPGSALDRKMQGWPMKIIFALALFGFAPSIIDIIINQCTEAGLFTFEASV